MNSWLIDDAPGERVAALVEAGRVVELHIRRLGRLTAGETGEGRIGTRTGKDGAFLISDSGETLLVPNGVTSPEGARVRFQVKRAAIAEPGGTKLSVAELVGAEAVSSIMDLPEGEAADLSDHFDAALAGEIAIAGGTISFERTRAGLVFDVDAPGDGHAANLAAARKIAALLRLWQISGVVLIDFISSASKAARAEIGEAFDQAAISDTRPFERTAVNGFGLMQIVRARPGPSFLDHLLGEERATASAETQAFWLLRAAERSTGFGERTITASPAVAALLNAPDWAALRDRVLRKTGATLRIVAEPGLAGYGHIHVSQS